ncbi:hypothetical protein [[Mycoplasma] testudinis]|uniref:hypothetical protein n=1 Tax=[Mycoplasma] testudinis TaxID=33924 RepID=UPI0004803EF3|nr:hypothetical protein [[Mycoplasma] testudinis]
MKKLFERTIRYLFVIIFILPAYAFLFVASSLQTSFKRLKEKIASLKTNARLFCFVWFWSLPVFLSLLILYKAAYYIGQLFHHLGRLICPELSSLSLYALRPENQKHKISYQSINLEKTNIYNCLAIKNYSVQIGKIYFRFWN